MKGNAAAAEPTVTALARALPDSPAVLAEVGQLELLKGNRRAARTAFARALEKEPLLLEAIAGLVAMDIQDGNPAAVRSRLDAAVAAAPASPALLLLASRAHRQLGDLAAAERWALQAIEADPNEIDAYGILGGLYISQQRLDDAIAQFRAVLDKRPESIAANTAAGMLFEMQGKPAEARRLYERALEINPQAAVAANNLAWMHVTTGGNLDVALRLAQTAKAVLPNRHEVNDTLGWIYVRKGLASLGVPPLVDAVKQAPDRASYHYHLGMAYLGTDDKAQARASLSRALELDADFEGADEARRALTSME
jgi:tetratricopeptide (TPR) repeat protein